MPKLSDFLPFLRRPPSMAENPAPTPAAEAPRIGRFPLVKSLGRGAQGAVYLARDPDLDRLVAIKLLGALPGQAVDTDGAWPQARNLARLRHPNIVALHEFGKHNSLPYLVFEYLEGTTLAEELKTKGRFAADAACQAMLQVSAAIAHAHAQGVLHLDLNPGNVMRDKEGNLRVMDFDVSRRAGAPPQAGNAAGTLAYMAPEYFTGGALDERTDVYALGQMLYTLLAGTPAFGGGTEAEIIERIRAGRLDLAPFQAFDPDGRLTAIIRRATDIDPAQRFANAGALHEALLAAARKEPAATAATHGTVAFLLKRMEHRGDFPAISRTLVEINRIIGDEKATVEHLTAAVLRDYALTSRLLKLANSAYFARKAGEVTTVSQAIKVLGFSEVRMTANAIACFGHFSGGRQKHLREEAIASFIAGLIARHLEGQLGAKNIEEAFIAGMLFNLGKTLALFYFPEDHFEIESLIAHGTPPDEAATRILGITLPELGRAVGELWGLPPLVLDCMRNVPAPTEDSEKMRAVVRFANALCAVDAGHPATGEAVNAGAASLPAPLQLGPAEISTLLRAAVEKFKAFAPTLEVDVSRSTCVQRLEAWLAPQAAASPE